MATRHGHLSVQMLDKLGVSVSAFIPVAVDDTKTVAAALGDVTTATQRLDQVSDSQIMKAGLTILGPIYGSAKTAPAATAENERTGLFNMRQNTSPYKFGVDVPAIAESLITNGKIDLSQAVITALITYLTTAGSALTPETTSLYLMSALADALLTFRKHRRAENRRSFEVA